MVKLPTPPWARRREFCPNCLDRIADQRALVCIRCGYQLRLPRISIVGLGAIGAGIAGFLVSAFGGWIVPFPQLPFGVKIPFLENPTPADLQALAAWTGGVLLLLGIILAFSGAYSVRRRTNEVVRRGERLA